MSPGYSESNSEQKREIAPEFASFAISLSIAQQTLQIDLDENGGCCYFIAPPAGFSSSLREGVLCGTLSFWSDPAGGLQDVRDVRR